MFSVDGLATGIDTATIIDGLLSLRQNQIDRLNLRKQDLQTEQQAFKGVESRLFALQGSINEFTRISGNVFQRKIIASSDEDAMKAAVSNSAEPGIYRFTTTALAKAHQISTDGFSSETAEIEQGTLSLQTGNGEIVDVVIDSSNNTVEGFVNAINSSSAAVSAIVINDGSASDPYRVLITSDESGTENEITTHTFTPVGGATGEAINFQADDVQAAADAAIQVGSGVGAIQITSSTNEIDDVFPGVTLQLFQADPATELTLTVSRDVETAKESLSDFVAKYNDVISYINEQARFDDETNTASVLFGNRTVNSIQTQLSQTVTATISGLKNEFSRLSTIGITIGSSGLLEVDSAKLDDALNGNLDNVDFEDIAKLFGLSGSTDNPSVDFVLATDDTALPGENTYKAVIINAAEQASVSATSALASSIVIDSSNDQFSLKVDGKVSETINLANGTYTQSELASHLETVINNHEEFSARNVTVSLSGSNLVITSDTYGASSEITSLSGTALSTLGFSGLETDTGEDVLGHFVVTDKDGKETTEEAVGRGRTLIGRAEKEEDRGFTEGLELRVNLTPAQVSSDVEVDNVTFSRGIASLLNIAITSITDTVDGDVATLNSEFEDRIQSIDDSIDRLNRQFEAQRESLARRFAALESSVAEIQNTGNILAAQLPSLPGFG